METIINFFTPYYHLICGIFLGKDLTNVVGDKFGIPWWRVHEYILAWLIIYSILTTILIVILLRRKHGTDIHSV
jgi:hypothetical protein